MAKPGGEAAPRVLVVDDEESITELVSMALRYEGFDVQTASSGYRALEKIDDFRPDLIMLDVMLPDIDGFNIAERLRRDRRDIPVLFLTARDATEDKVRGLTIGGDDYVTKPFSVAELVARTQAILRRVGKGGPTRELLELADLEMDDDAHEVRRAGQLIELTATEYRLLRYLLANPRRVLTRSQLLDHVWNYDFGGDAGVLETYISYLRKKVDFTEPHLIHTVRGVGYVLRPPHGSPGVVSHTTPRSRRLRRRPCVSLKARLIGALCVLVLVALATVDAITYASFRTYVVGQVDTQLLQSAPLVLDRLGGPGIFGGAPETNQFIQHGTMAAELSPKGQQVVTWQIWVESPTQSSFEPATTSFPVLPASLAGQAANSPSAPVYATVPGNGGVRSYRVFEGLLNTGNVLAEAVPLTATDATLRHLLRLELLVSGAVLIALAAATLLVIRLSLRPLEDMAETAGEIANGDLSRRVEDTDERTEVGRLGRALNVMLARIEAAFREREASEARLRRFVADASHELRTPLTSIRGYAELFRHGLAERPDDLDAAMRRIESESTRMAGLVDDLLLLARLDQRRPLEREQIDLATLVADAAQDARVIDPSRNVSCEVPASCRIIGDESRLRQLLGNLVSNALAYTPAGSPFEIIVAHTPPAGTAPARVSIAVVDHGPGISTEAVEHIFERFWRSDPGRVRAQGGSGLGLSIVLAIARAHGGDVSVTETPGGGATFTVQLPTEPLAGSSAWGTGSTVDGESNRNGARAPEDSHFARSSDGTTGDLSPAPETGS